MAYWRYARHRSAQTPSGSKSWRALLFHHRRANHMHQIAALCIVAGFGLLAYAAGRLAQFIEDRRTIMASQNIITLSAAVDDLLAANATQATTIADLQAQLAAPNPATQALADEETAEDALTAKIRAVVPVNAASGAGA